MKIKIKRGFTLTELIIVIAIIGILAAVLIPSLTGYINKAKLSADRQEAASMNKIINTYLIENPEMASNLDGGNIRTIINSLSGSKFDFISNNANHGYYYWYDIENKKVEVSKVSALKEPVTAANEFHSFDEIIPGYILLEKEGCVLADIVNDFRNIVSNDDYNKIIKAINPATKDSKDSLYNDIVGLSDQQKTKIYNEFSNTFNVKDTVFVNNFNSFTGLSNDKKYVIFEEGVTTIPQNALKGFTLPEKLVIPYSVNFIESQALGGVSTEVKIIRSNIENDLKKASDSFSESILKANPELKNLKDIIDYNLDDQIEVVAEIKKDKDDQDIVHTTTGVDTTVNYKEYTISFNPKVKDSEGNIFMATSATLKYKENNNGTISVSMKLYCKDGIIGEKKVTYKQYTDLKTSLTGYTYSFENLSKYFPTELKYRISVGSNGNIKTFDINANDINGIYGEQFICGQKNEEVLYTYAEFVKFIGRQKDYKLAADSYETEKFISNPGFKQEISDPIYDNTKITKSTLFDNTKTEIYYKFDDEDRDGNGFIYKYVTKSGVTSTYVTNMEKVSNLTEYGDYDVSYIDISTNQEYSQKKYIIDEYSLDANLFIDNKLPIKIEVISGENTIIEKIVNYSDVNTYYSEETLAFTTNNAQELATFKFDACINNIFNINSMVEGFSSYIEKGETKIQNFTSEKVNNYWKDGKNISDLHILKICGTYNNKQLDLVYIISDLDTSAITSIEKMFKLEIAAGYYYYEDNKRVNVNENLGSSINYDPVELTYKVIEPKEIELSKLNNRELNETGTKDNPFIFYLNEEINYTYASQFLVDGLFSKSFEKKYLDIVGFDTSCITKDGDPNELTIKYFPNDYTEYANCKIFYKVKENEKCNITQINNRYVTSDPFTFYIGENIAIFNSATQIEYLIGNKTEIRNLYAGQINDILSHKELLDIKREDGTSVFKNSIVLTDYRFYKKNTGDYVLLDIDFNTSQVITNFDEVESGTLKFEFVTTLRGDSSTEYSSTGEYKYVIEIPYNVIAEDKSINNVVVNNRSVQFDDKPFTFAAGEMIYLSYGTYVQNYKPGNAIFTNYANVFDMCHDNLSVYDYMIKNSSLSSENNYLKFLDLFTYVNFYSSDSIDGSFERLIPYYYRDDNRYPFEEAEVNKLATHFTYEDGKKKYLKIEVKYNGLVSTVVIPYTVLKEKPSESLTKLVPFSINGTTYNEVDGFSFKNGSTLGLNPLTKFLYNSNGRNDFYNVIYGNNTNIMYSFDNENFVKGDELVFVGPSSQEINILYIYIRYKYNEIYYTGTIKYKIVSEENSIQDANVTYLNYRSTSSSQNVTNKNEFVFMYGETFIFNFYTVGNDKKIMFENNHFQFQYVDDFNKLHSISITTVNATNFKIQLKKVDGSDLEINLDTLNDPNKKIYNFQFGIDYPNSGEIKYIYTIGEKDYVAKQRYIVSNEKMIRTVNNELFIDNNLYNGNYLDLNISCINLSTVYNNKDNTKYINRYYQASFPLLINNQEIKSTATWENGDLFSLEYAAKLMTSEFPNPIVLEISVKGPNDYIDSLSFTFYYINDESVDIVTKTDYDFLIENINYQLIKNQTFATEVNNRYNNYNDIFTFYNNELFDGGLIRISYKYNGSYYNSFMTKDSPSYCSIYLKDETLLSTITGKAFEDVYLSGINNECQDILEGDYKLRFSSGQEGYIVIYSVRGRTLYETRIPFKVNNEDSPNTVSVEILENETSKTIQGTRGFISKIDGTEYYNESDKLKIITGTKIALNSYSSISYQKDTNYYSKYYFSSNSDYLRYYVKTTDLEPYKEISYQIVDNIAVLNFEFLDNLTGTLLVIYYPGGKETINPVICERPFEVIGELSAYIQKINSRNISYKENNEQKDDFIFRDGEQLFKNINGEYSHNGYSTFIYKELNGITRTSAFYFNNNSYVYYVIPTGSGPNIEDEDPYEKYIVREDYRFERGQKGVLRISYIRNGIEFIMNVNFSVEETIDKSSMLEQIVFTKEYKKIIDKEEITYLSDSLFKKTDLNDCSEDNPLKLTKGFFINKNSLTRMTYNSSTNSSETFANAYYSDTYFNIYLMLKNNNTSEYNKSLYNNQKFEEGQAGYLLFEYDLFGVKFTTKLYFIVTN